jgi:hypothetical protein
MTVDVATERVIHRPIDAVAGYAAEPANAPEWYQKIESVELQTDPPLRVGSKMTFVARFMGRRLEYTYAVVDLVPGERLVMRTEQGPFPMETTYSWTPLDAESTRMTLRNRGEPAGFGRLAAAVMKPAMRRANRKDLAKLAAILESSTHGRG